MHSGAPMVTRRRVLAAGLSACFGYTISGCVRLRDLQPDCPIDFAPSLIAPVFYGIRDYPDPRIRVYFPSIDGSPQQAAILAQCERYPLILLVHGDCSGNHFDQWFSLPRQLARSGYVVVVTEFGGKLGTGNPEDTAPLRLVHDWMRSTWEFRDRLLSAPHTGVIGHSFGGTLAAQLVTEIPASALVSLSGAFGQLGNPASALAGIRVPALFTWNDIDDPQLGAELFTPKKPAEGQPWFDIGVPKHGVIFHGGNHGDYLGADAPRCARQGTCFLARSLADDFVTTFMSKYLRPEFAFTAFTWVPETLFVRPQDLPVPPAQGFYAGNYLQGFGASGQASARPAGPCVETVMWETVLGSGSTFVETKVATG